MNVILSIKPQYVEEILAGRKRYEYRKSVFKQKVEKVYIYASAPVSKIVGEFEPVDVVSDEPAAVWTKTRELSGITKHFFDEYYKGRGTAYAIKIKNLVIYDEPKVLPIHAPQSFRYIDKL